MLDNARLYIAHVTKKLFTNKNHKSRILLSTEHVYDIMGCKENN